jgi:hypothetical protein
MLRKVAVIGGKVIYYDKSFVEMAKENGCEEHWFVRVLDLAHWEKYSAKMKAEGYDGKPVDIVVLENDMPMTSKEVCDAIAELKLERGWYEHLVAAAWHYPGGHVVALGMEMRFFGDPGLMCGLPGDPAVNSPGKPNIKKYVPKLVVNDGRYVLGMEDCDKIWPAGTYFIAVSASLLEE